MQCRGENGVRTQVNRYQSQSLRRSLPKTLVLCAGLSFVVSSVWAGEGEREVRETNIRAGSSQTIVSVRGNRPSSIRRVDGVTASAAVAYPHPRPRLAGFSPLVAITTTDAGFPIGHDLEFEQTVEYSYVGSPLNPSAQPGFVIGFLDSGADVALAAGRFAEQLGLVWPNLTPNSIPIGGVGGQVQAPITVPVGFFAAGLSAIDSFGALDYGALVGHSNVCGLAAPPIECGNGEILSAVVGMPMMAFFNSHIRVDMPRIVTVDGITYQSPDVQLLHPFDSLPFYEHLISIELGGLAPFVTTANYYPDFLDLETPIFPTLMSAGPGLIPFGGLFYADVFVREGDPDPDNPVQPMRMLVDTGAQSSIMSPHVAANLSLPFEPDFEVDVCGVGGLVSGVPGYWIDFVKINATGGALEYSKAPFVILDLASPEGGSLDGVLGMNFFWNRNIIVEPVWGVTGLATANFHVSDPIPVAYADNDVDFDVDHADAATQLSCLTGPGPTIVNPECDHFDAEGDSDIDLIDFQRLQICFSGAGETADPQCSP